MSPVMGDLTGLRVVQYARVSTDDKDQTVETQKIAMDKWCAQNGVRVVGFYSEHMTGSTLNRPELKKALAECMFDGADILLAYDQSRLTRGDDLKKIVEQIAPAKVYTVVMGNISADDLATKVTTAIRGIFDEEENKVRRSKTKMGIKTRQEVYDKHCGRPAKFMFVEDLEDFHKGRSKPEHESADGRVMPQTIIISEDLFYGYAKAGYSLAWVAKNILHCSKTALYSEIKLQESEPKYRLRNYAKNVPNPKFPDDYVAYYRFKGKKDRFTPYMTFYEQAIKGRKTIGEENVGKTDENGSEKVGVA